MKIKGRISASVRWIGILVLFTSIGQNILHASQAERIVILGDSITAGYGLGKEAAYPARLQEKIESRGLNYKIINAGVSGDTTASGLRRVQWALGQEPPAVVIIALGGNDGLRGIPVKETHANLSGIIDAIRKFDPATKILVAGMRMPASMGREYTESFYATFRQVAEEKGTHWLPFLLEGVGGNAKLNQPDQIHPNAEGQKQIARTVWSALQPLLD